MNLELPDDTVAFAAVIARALVDETVDLFVALDALGVLDLTGSESADPEHAHVNVAVALEQIAGAGRRAPVAETIWARGHGLDTGRGFVAATCDEHAGADRFVPYGSVALSLLAGPLDAPAVVSMPVAARPARIEIDLGHLWLPATFVAPSLASLDQPFAWRAAAATTVGAMARATDMAIEHARNRVQFGKPLASFQALQFRLAECHWRLLGLRLLVREAAWRADRGDPRAAAVSALAWLYARDVGRIVTKHVHQVHGAIGFTRELGLTTLTGSVATLRAIHPAGRAARVVQAARGWEGAVPPSTVLGGFPHGDVLSVASKAGQRLAHRIEAEILAAGHRPGERLGGEAELIERYDTSRTLLREAVRLLEHDGICEMRRGPGGGLHVVAMDSNAVTHAAALWLHFTDAPVDDLYDVRTLLESRCATWAAERIDADGVARLRACREREDAAIDACDPTALTIAVNDFHVAVAEIAGNAVALLFVKVLSELNESYAGSPEYDPDDLAAVRHAHTAIADAIIAGDPVMAAHRTLRHLRASARFLTGVRPT